MRAPVVILSAQSTVQDAMNLIGASDLDAFPVSDPAPGKDSLQGTGFRGMIRRADLAKALTLEAGETTLADILASQPAEFTHVHPDHLLHLALERMGASGINVLPVVSRASIHQLIGIVTLDDVLKAYRVTGRES